MKIYNYIFCFGLMVMACHLNAWAGVQIDSIGDNRSRQQVLIDYQRHLAPNTFLLTTIGNRTITRGNADFSYTGGDFYSPLEMGNNKGVNVDVASLLKIGEWNLFGGFSYKNKFAGKSRSALMYPVNYEDNPLFLFQHHSSEWNTQQYRFSVKGARKVGCGRWRIGFMGTYSGYLAYKQTDIRNEQTTLDMILGAGAGYQLSSQWLLGLDVSYNWTKTSPNFSIVYNHQPDDIYFKNYMNVGYGTVITSPGYNFKVLDSRPVLSLSAFHNTHKKRDLFRWEGYVHRQKWTDESVKDAGRDNKPYKFHGEGFNALYQHLEKKDRHEWVSEIRLKGGRGRSYYKEAVGDPFKDPYFYRMLGAGIVVGRESYADILWKKIEIGFSTDYHWMRDKNFGTSLRVIAFSPDMRAELCFPLNEKHRVSG